MPLAGALLDSYNCPVLLRSRNMHREHLKSESQELKLPPYTSSSAGQIIVDHGEVFCHVPSCQHKHIAIPATDIRQQLIRHGFQVATNTSEQLKQAQQDAAVQWYNSVQEAEEDDDDEDEYYEEDVEQNVEDKNDLDYEDDHEEGDEDEDEDYD